MGTLNCLLTHAIQSILQPGRLKKVQAIGWYLEEANMAQVSVNITDFETTPIHLVYEEVCKDAKVSLFISGLSKQSLVYLDVLHINCTYNVFQDLSLAVCGSQVVGLVPLKAIMDCAEYYMKKENLFILEEDQKIRLVCLYHKNCLFLIKRSFSNM